MTEWFVDGARATHNPTAQTLEVGQQWYVCFGRSSKVDSVTVKELTEATVLLELPRQQELAMFGIFDLPPIEDRYALSAIKWLEELPTK